MKIELTPAELLTLFLRKEGNFEHPVDIVASLNWSEKMTPDKMIQEVMEAQKLFLQYIGVTNENNTSLS